MPISALLFLIPLTVLSVMFWDTIVKKSEPAYMNILLFVAPLAMRYNYRNYSPSNFEGMDVFAQSVFWYVVPLIYVVSIIGAIHGVRSPRIKREYQVLEENVLYPKSKTLWISRLVFVLSAIGLYVGISFVGPEVALILVSFSGLFVAMYVEKKECTDFLDKKMAALGFIKFDGPNNFRAYKKKDEPAVWRVGYSKNNSIEGFILDRRWWG